MKGLINFPGPWVSHAYLLEWGQFFFFFNSLKRDNHTFFFLRICLYLFFPRKSILCVVCQKTREPWLTALNFLPVILFFPSHCVPWCKVWQNRWPFPHPKNRGTAESHFVCGRPHTKKRVDNYRDPKPSVNHLWPSAIQAVTRLIPGPSFISTCLSYVWQNAWVSQAIIQGLFLSLWSLCLLQLWKTGAQNGNGNNSELLRVYSI